MSHNFNNPRINLERFSNISRVRNFSKNKLSPSPPPCNLLSLLRIHNFETFPSFTKRKKERKVKIKKLDPASAIIRIVPFASPPLNFLDRYRDDLQKFSGRDRLSSDRLKQLSGCFVPRRVHEASKHGRFPPMGYLPSWTTSTWKPIIH